MATVTAVKKNKYTYYKVIQEYHGQWDDSDFHETDSNFYFKTKEAKAAYKENLKAYHENAGCPIRTICRKELNID
jgi:hypothetical protein